MTNKNDSATATILSWLNDDVAAKKITAEEANAIFCDYIDVLADCSADTVRDACPPTLPTGQAA